MGTLFETFTAQPGLEQEHRTPELWGLVAVDEYRHQVSNVVPKAKEEF